MPEASKVHTALHPLFERMFERCTEEYTGYDLEIITQGELPPEKNMELDKIYIKAENNQICYAVLGPDSKSVSGVYSTDNSDENAKLLTKLGLLRKCLDELSRTGVQREDGFPLNAITSSTGYDVDTKNYANHLKELCTKSEDKSIEKLLHEEKDRLQGPFLEFTASQKHTLPRRVVNPEGFLSDHLPILTKVPLVSEGEESELKIASWNVMGLNAENAFGYIEEEGCARYQRIAGKLKEMADGNQLDIIALQEVNYGEMKPILQNSFSDEWGIKDDGHTPLITLYRKGALTIDKDKQAKQEDRIRALSYTFRHTASGKTLDFHNFWGVFNGLPTRQQQQIKQMLGSTSTTGSNIAVVIGDCNMNGAPVPGSNNDSLGNRPIATSAAPPLANAYRGILRNDVYNDFVDHCFMQARGSSVIKQINHDIVDTSTSRSFVPDIDQYTDIEAIDYYPISCLDDYYKAELLIGRFTVFEYETLLKQHIFSNPEDIGSFRVYPTANSLNQRGVAIAFPLSWSERPKIRELLGELKGKDFVNVEDGGKNPSSALYYFPRQCSQSGDAQMIFVAEENIPKMNSIILGSLWRQNQNKQDFTLAKKVLKSFCDNEIERFKSETRSSSFFAKSSGDQKKQLILKLTDVIGESKNKNELVKSIKTWKSANTVALKEHRGVFAFVERLLDYVFGWRTNTEIFTDNLISFASNLKQESSDNGSDENASPPSPS